MDSEWKHLWRRIKRQAEVKTSFSNEDDFPVNYGTADEILTQKLPETLETVAEEIEKPPQPTRRYRIGEKLENASEKSILGHRGKRTLSGSIGGFWAAYTRLWQLEALNEPPTAESVGYWVGFTLAGTAILGGGDWAVSKMLEKAGENLKSEDNKFQSTSNVVYESPRLIKNRLSDREANYAFKAFREDGLSWAENVSKAEIEEFLDELSAKSEADWRVKRKEDHPIQVIGISAEYQNPEDPTYQKRNEIAQKTAEDEGVPIEEILDVDEDNLNNLDPVPTSDRFDEPNPQYEFLIVDINPEYTFDIENDWLDYSSILGITSEGYEQEEISEEQEELIEERV